MNSDGDQRARLSLVGSTIHHHSLPNRAWYMSLHNKITIVSTSLFHCNAIKDSFNALDLVVIVVVVVVVAAVVVVAVKETFE